MSLDLYTGPSTLHLLVDSLGLGSGAPSVCQHHPPLARATFGISDVAQSRNTQRCEVSDSTILTTRHG